MEIVETCHFENQIYVGVYSEAKWAMIECKESHIVMCFQGIKE